MLVSEQTPLQKKRLNFGTASAWAGSGARSASPTSVSSSKGSSSGEELRCAGCQTGVQSNDPVTGQGPRRWGQYSKADRPVGTACYYCFRAHRRHFLKRGMTWSALVTALHMECDAEVIAQYSYAMNKTISSHQMGRARVSTTDCSSSEAPSDVETDVGKSTCSNKPVQEPCLGTKMTWVPYQEYTLVHKTLVLNRDRFLTKEGELGVLTPLESWAAEKRAGIGASRGVSVVGSSAGRSLEQAAGEESAPAKRRSKLSCPLLNALISM